MWTNSTTTQQISGVELYLDFDPRYLQVSDASDVTNGIQIQHDDTALPIELANIVDNDTGEIIFSSGELSAPFPAGSFRVASITFTAISATPDSVGTPVRFSLSGDRVTKVSKAGAVIAGIHLDALIAVHEVELTIKFALQGGQRLPW